VDGRPNGRAAAPSEVGCAKVRAPSDVEGRPKFEPPKLDGRVPETDFGRRLVLPAARFPRGSVLNPVGQPSAPTPGTPARRSSAALGGEVRAAAPSDGSSGAACTGAKNGHDSAWIGPASTGGACGGLRRRTGLGAAVKLAP